MISLFTSIMAKNYWQFLFFFLLLKRNFSFCISQIQLNFEQYRRANTERSHKMPYRISRLIVSNQTDPFIAYKTLMIVIYLFVHGEACYCVDRRNGQQDASREDEKKMRHHHHQCAVKYQQ